LKIVKERLPDLVVSDLTMPEMDGFTLLEELKKDPETAHIPVIVVSAKDLTPEDEQRLAGQTSSIWLKGAFSTQDLVEHVVNTLSGPELGGATGPVRQRTKTQELEVAPLSSPVDSPGAKKVVLIEDDPMDARLISRILQLNRPLEIKQVQAGQEAVKTIRVELPDLVILDLAIPDKDGFEILAELKQDSQLDSIPVVVITAKDLSETEKELLNKSGVASMWQKGKFDRQKLVAHIEAQLEE
jgi:CheY-like chemotaxis protein